MTTNTHRTADGTLMELKYVEGVGTCLVPILDLTTDAARLADAIEHRDAARVEFDRAITAKGRRHADEELTFWQGKVAMLEAKIAHEATR